MTLIDGKALADKMAVELKAKVDDLKSAGVTTSEIKNVAQQQPVLTQKSFVYLKTRRKRHF